MQRPYGKYFQISLGFWLPQFWILWPGMSKIQGTERRILLAAVVYYMPYSVCSSKSRPIMTNILAVTRTQQIGATYREREMLRRKVRKSNEMKRNIVQKIVNMHRYGKLIDCFQLVFPQKSYTEPEDGETPPFLFITMLSLSY